MLVTYQKGDRVEVIADASKGRLGFIKRLGSVVFPDWCYITLDLKPRERVQKTIFIELIKITMAKTKTTVTTGVLDIPINEILPDPDQPRQSFDEASSIELAKSVAKDGILQPILVRPISSTGPSRNIGYLIAGQPTEFGKRTLHGLLFTRK